MLNDLLQNLSHTGMIADDLVSLFRSAMSQPQLSARAYHRILKLALTIADLAASECIQPAHLAEALQFRSRIMESG